MSVRDRIRNPGRARVWVGALSGGCKSAIKMPCILGLLDYFCAGRTAVFPLVLIGEKFRAQRRENNPYKSDIL